jgi:hypothetical protein
MEQVMRNAMLMLCAVLLAAGCGVNPDRLATMKERSASMAENKTTEASEGDEPPPLEFDDSDPAPIREAIMALEDLHKLVKAKKYDDYLKKRYEVMKTVSFEANEAVATSSKTPLIIDRVHALDLRVAKVAGGRAQEIVETVGRVQMASADALYALKDAFDACAQAAASSDEQQMKDLKSKYEAALDRAKAVDGKSLTFVGQKVTGTGYIDVPAEIAVCEARLALKQAEAADAPPAPEDLGKTYSGCGFYPVELEAKQTGQNKFGDFLITSAYVADADPGAARPVDCGEVPPVSDAPKDVQAVIKEFVAWLKPEDVVSMGGNFKYESGDDGKLTKKGTVHIYRKEATLKTNKCGAEDPNVTCEAEGSALATAYDHANHYLKRAEHYRSQGEPERCRRMAEKAAGAAGASTSEDASKMFQVRGGQKMSHADITAKLSELKKEAEKAKSGDWCDNP